MQEILFILAGLIILWFSTDFVISSAKNLAEKLMISETVIGLTIVSIGTSLPEIATNIQAGLMQAKGIEASGIAIGTIIGSNISQITLVLGIIGFISTMYLHKKSLYRDGIVMLFSSILLYFFALDLKITRIEGMILISIYLLYLGALLKQEKIFVERHKKKGVKTILEAVIVLIGTAIIVFSAGLIVENSVNLARILGVRETLIGLMVGLGTTLPELAVSIKAIMYKSKELSIGNIIGSNITDPLLSMGIGASISGFTVGISTIQFDFVFWIVATIIALLLLFNHTNLNRLESSVLIILYLFFIYMQFLVLG